MRTVSNCSFFLAHREAVELVLSVSRSIMCVERSASRRVASPPLFVAHHGLLSAHSRVTMSPDGLSFYIRRYRHDSLTATDDRGHAAARLGSRHPASLSAL